jgi:hypothetical protein
MGTTIQARVARLEAASSAGGEGGGCDRCRGLLVLVSNVITGEFHSAHWNGEALSEDEVRERKAETKCPKCGRRISPDETTTITVGGRREPR